jgi:phosphate ABC transporter permease subunit PstA
MKLPVPESSKEMSKRHQHQKKHRREVKGEPWVWLSGGAVAMGIIMIVGMMALITFEGTIAFWPYDINGYVMGQARFNVRHAQHGPVWVKRDDSGLVLAANRDAWRDLDGKIVVPPDVAPRRATFQDWLDDPAPFDGRDWELRAVGRLLHSADGAPATPDALRDRPRDYLPWEMRELGDFARRVHLDSPLHGEVFLFGDSGTLAVPLAWKSLDGQPVEFDFPSPRPATIVDFREHPKLFPGAEDHWLVFTPQGQPMQHEGETVTTARYLREPQTFPSRWGYQDELGTRVPIEVMLGDDRWRDRTLLVGTERGRREMDIRQLPPNPDGTPVQPFQLTTSPKEVLVRQGNQGQTLYGESLYFRWVRLDLPDPPAAKRHRLSTYEETVLTSAPMPYAVLIERLERGVLTGYITRVTVAGEVLAEAERDGREKVWEVFKREQQRMRQEYLSRYSLEKYDIGRVNFELKAREDRIKRIRYEHRLSRSVVTGVDRLNFTYADWERREPFPDPNLGAGAFREQTQEWLASFNADLDAWWDGMDDLHLSDVESAALHSARKIQAERARIQAENFSSLRHDVVSRRAAEQAATYDFVTADGREATLVLSEVVRAFRPNELGLFGKLGVYLDRVWEYLTDDPRESNTEGGIWPVILGTLIMTMLMAVAVVPFGVIAALYLREYAKQGTLVSTVRISVNNLAGVPSIVFGIFGLGFFCVIVGGTLDDLFFPELQPAPMFGGGGILWASLTLALLTVPVVVVSTEEALSAVPSSQREASLACGASKFQTVWRIVLPQALPGVLTGTILAMARGAGEVAPLMLVGAVKYAPYPPVDALPPFIHLERKFMHLGFHVYDVGFQSPNVDNTKPLVFATSLALIAMVAILNVFAISLRNRLRRKYATSAV